MERQDKPPIPWRTAAAAVSTFASSIPRFGSVCCSLYILRRHSVVGVTSRRNMGCSDEQWELGRLFASEIQTSLLLCATSEPVDTWAHRIASRLMGARCMRRIHVLVQSSEIIASPLLTVAFQNDDKRPHRFVHEGPTLVLFRPSTRSRSRGNRIPKQGRF